MLTEEMFCGRVPPREEGRLGDSDLPQTRSGTGGCEALRSAAEGLGAGCRRGPQARAARTGEEEAHRLLESEEGCLNPGGDVGFAALNYFDLECVPPSSQVRYKALVESFLRVFLHSHPKKCRDGPRDQAMAEFMNRLYLRGHKSKVGDKLIAAWAVFFPKHISSIVIVDIKRPVAAG